MKPGGIPVYGSAASGWNEKLPRRYWTKNKYYLTKEKATLRSVFAVNGCGFAGRGQNTGIAFVFLKNWSERPGEENKVEAITSVQSAHSRQ
ncbi:efflux RND transporter permease subunit [Shigella flexneri]